MEVAFFEPWYGGSHRAFLDSWTRRSRHRITVHGLAPRHWKWRQEASAWDLARRVADAPAPDVIACSDFVDLPRLMGFLPRSWRGLPTLVYFHENQLTYQADGADEDFTHGFCNVLSAVRADRVVFNSEFHRDDFAAAADRLLARLPRPNPRALLRERLSSAVVVAPMPELQDVPLGAGSPAGPPTEAPLRVAFPHRLEPDKDPCAFLRAVAQLRDEHSPAPSPIEIVLLGGRLDRASPEIRHAAEALAGITLHAGYADSREEYLAHLASADLVVSTARHEFFGLAFAEAMAAGCTPLAPDRLNYPALTAGVPEPTAALFNTDAALTEALRWWSQPAGRAQLRSPGHRTAIRTAVLPFDAAEASTHLDGVIEPLGQADL